MLASLLLWITLSVGAVIATIRIGALNIRAIIRAEYQWRCRHRHWRNYTP